MPRSRQASPDRLRLDRQRLRQHAGPGRDETFRRDLADGFLSYYDETKYLAHVAAEARVAAGAPIVIVQPGTVYGPGDHSGVGAQLKAAYDGTARVSSPSRAPGSRRRTSTTSRAGSSPPSIAGGSARPTSWRREHAARQAMDRRRAPPGAGRRASASRMRAAPRVAPLAGCRRVVRPVAEPQGDRQRLRRRHLLGEHAKAVAELGYAPRDLGERRRDAFGHL